ncbi:hypothetical protein J437_LFUL004201 [Ladona fulva]|uniref:Uncharacterized protein n=1 Tax=Ladona fulva TaxID=123851 RepID=A0A8K0NXX3_LADFU|nr:hypothetical protein J437_LFUL004201 [Ladona fulva]
MTFNLNDWVWKRFGHGSGGSGNGGSNEGVGVWLSVLLGGLSMLAKETGVTVMVVNLTYDLYRSWPFIKRTIVEIRWNEETLLFSRRAAKVLISPHQFSVMILRTFFFHFQIVILGCFRSISTALIPTSEVSLYE